MEAYEFLTIDEVAEALRCSRAHVYRLISIGSIAAVDISIPGARKSKARIPADELRRFIQSAQF